MTVFSKVLVCVFAGALIAGCSSGPHRSGKGNDHLVMYRSDSAEETTKVVHTREVVPGSIIVYPIKDFGAIELGSHRFCQTATGKCEGLADFTTVWQRTDAGWKITRVLSYGHRGKPGEP